MTIQQAQETIANMNAKRIPYDEGLRDQAIKTLAEVRRGVNFGVPSTVSQSQNVNIGSAPGTYGPLGYEASAGMFKNGTQPNVPNTTAANYVPGVSAPASSGGIQNPFGTSSTTTGSTSAGTNGFPRFSFDLETEQRAAFEKLKPFYEDLLNMSKGDLDLAKRMLEFTYTQGTRESQQEYEQATREQAYQFPQEQRAFQEEMNRRGMLQSQVTQTGQQPGRFELGESQGLRAEAVKRALENRRETLTQSRGFGLEGEQNKFAREEKNLAKDQRTEASGMAMNKFSMESAKYGAQVGEWQSNEQRRQFEASQALSRELANRSA